MSGKPWAIGCGIAALLGLFVVVVLAVAGVAGWFWFQGQRTVPVSTSPTAPSDPTTQAIEETAPAVSLTAAWVFVRLDQIYFKADDAAPEQQLCRGSFPALSPDGRRIAFFRRGADEDDPGGSWCVFEIASRQTRELIPSGGALSPPAWSPDGSAIAAAVVANENVVSLMVLDPGGSIPREITGTQAEPAINNLILFPNWSGDGQRIFFHDMAKLYVVQLDGVIVRRTPLEAITGSATSVTSTDAFRICPTDPNVIAFTQMVPSEGGMLALNGEPTNALFLYNLADQSRRQLTPGSMLATDPQWSRDGRTLLFCGYRGESVRENHPFRIFRIRREDGVLTELERGEQPGT